MQKGDDDFERKVTSHWVTHIIGRKFQLKTERKEYGYVISPGEGAKLGRLLEKYDIVADNQGLAELPELPELSGG